MKTKIYTIALAAAVSLTLASCSDNWEPADGSEGMGQMTMHDIDVVNSATVIPNRAGIDTSDFIVTVVGSDGSIAGEWKYGNMPEVITLPAKTGYHVEVISHNQEKAAWEAPYFEGRSSQFDIVDGEITEIGTVTCRLANIKVTIAYTEAMKSAMGSDCKVTVIANDEGRLEFLPNETRAGYFQALEGSSTLVVTFTGTVNGNNETITIPVKDVEGGQHRIFTFGIQSGNNHIPEETGYIDPASGIFVDFSTIDESVEGNVSPGDEEVIGGNRPGQEDPETPEEPDPNKPTPDEPNDEELFDVTCDVVNFNAENSIVDGAEYKVLINSKNPLSNLIVEIISESLSDDMLRGVGLQAKFDLAYPGDLEVALSTPAPDGFGFPTGDKVIGQKSVIFDITSFVPLLNVYKGEVHEFKLTIKDQNGNEKVVSLKFRT